MLQNTGADCTLQGFPVLQLVAADGHLLPTTTVAEATGEPGPPPATVHHLTTATSDLRWLGGPCTLGRDDGGRPSSVTVTVPGSARGVRPKWAFGAVCGAANGPAEINAAPLVAN
jgi:hypothetical protein